MAKFCGKCGAELKEGSKFCVKCGAPVPQTGVQGDTVQQGNMQRNAQGTYQQGMPNAQGAYQQGVPNTQGAYQQGMPNTQGRYAGALGIKKPAAWKLIAAIAAVVVVLAAVLFGVFGTRGYEKPIKYMEKGINDGDIKTFAKAFPDGVEGIVSFLPDDLSEVFPGYDVKFDIVDKEKLDKDEMAVVLSEEYNMSASEIQKVSAAYILNVEISAEVNGEEDLDEEEIPVVKMDGKWVIPMSMFW